MQKTSYEVRISDWSSDVCSSDLAGVTKMAADTVKFGRGRIEAQRLHMGELFLNLTAIFVDAQFVDQNFYPRLELVVAPAIAVIDAKARLHVGNQFVFGHEVLDFRGDHRRASHAAARKDFCSDARSEEHTSELQSLM